MVAVRLRSGSVRDTTLARLSRAPRPSKPATTSLSSNRGPPFTRAPASAQRAASAAMASGARAGARGKENGGQPWAVYKQQAQSRTKPPPAAQPTRQSTASYTSVRAKQRHAAAATAAGSAAGGSEGADGGEDLMARLQAQLEANAALLNRDPNTAEAM